MSRAAPDAKLFDRLTKGERDCLSRVFDHRTAKEIALELGISHHAVEKRLRRAREKLGAQSSIEAARWANQHYDQTGYGAADLAAGIDPSHPPQISANSVPQLRRSAMMIGLVASLAAIGLLSIQETSQPETEAIAASLSDAIAEDRREAHEAFSRLDADGSGSIEREEYVSPTSHYVFDQSKPDAPDGQSVYFEVDEVTVTPLDGKELERVLVTLDDEDTRKRREIMFDLIDRDGDGRIEETEFTMAHLDGIAPRTLTIELAPEDG